MHALTTFESDHNFLFRSDINDERRVTPLESIQDIISILQETGQAAEGVNRIRKRRKQGLYDVILLKSILAGVALHKSGVFSVIVGGKPDIQLSSIQKDFFLAHLDKTFDESEEIAVAYGLNKAEVKAVKAYTSPNKADRNSEYYMWGDFGGFADGWAALTSALLKMPNFEQLGLTVCTFRVTRDSKESNQFKLYQPGTMRLVLGAEKMDRGQYHQTSTSISYSVHLTDEKVKNGNGLLAYFGSAGVYINWLGVMTPAVDGCEVLYPPGTIMHYSSHLPFGYKSMTGDYFPVYVLEEIPSFSEEYLKQKGVVYRDDFYFKKLEDASKINKVRADQRIADLLGFF